MKYVSERTILLTAYDELFVEPPSPTRWVGMRVLSRIYDRLLGLRLAADHSTTRFFDDEWLASLDQSILGIEVPKKDVTS